MKKELISFALMGLVVVSQNSSGSVVENYVKSGATGGNTKVETNINTKINETETNVRVNQPGEIELKVENSQVSIEKSPGMRPTIIITSYPPVTPTIKVEDNISFNKRKNVRVIPIYNLLKGLFSKLFGFFH